MSKRVPGSMRTRQSLCDLIEGRLSSPDGRAELEQAKEAEQPKMPGNRSVVGIAWLKQGGSAQQDETQSIEKIDLEQVRYTEHPGIV